MSWSETTQNTVMFAAIALGGAGVVVLQATHSRFPADPYSFVQWTDWLVFTPGPALTILGGGAAVALGVYGLLAPHVVAHIVPYLPRRSDDAPRAEKCARIGLQLAMLRTKDGLPGDPALDRRQIQAIDRVLKSRIWRDVRAHEAFLADDVAAALVRLRDTARRRPWEIERFRDLGILLAGHAPDEAQTILALAERMEPGDFWSRLVLAQLAGRQGEANDAETQARAAIEAAADDGERMIGLNALARILLAQDDVATAFLLCRQAYDLARRHRGTGGETAVARQALAGTFEDIARMLVERGTLGQAEEARMEAHALCPAPSDDAAGQGAGG